MRPGWYVKNSTSSSTFEPARITLETLNLVQKYSDLCSFRKVTYRSQLSLKFDDIIS